MITNRPSAVLAVSALCVSVLGGLGCQKPGAAKVDDKVDGKAVADDGKVAASDAAGGAVQGATTVTVCPKSLGGSDKLHRVISKDCGEVPVTEDYYVDGGSLTLEAGASLAFKDGAGLYIGYYEPAKLIVKGTAEAPVVLTAAGDKVAGSWRGVSLNANADRSSLEGLVIEYAGNDESALFVDAEDVTVRATKIRDVKGTAVLVGDAASFAAFADNELKKLGKPAAIDAPPRAVGGLGAGNRFDGGAHVLVRGGSVGKSQKWQSPGAPLVIAGEVNVDGEAGLRATLELAAGLELRFTAGAVLNVGYYGPGGLTVKGTAEAPVTFTAHEKREAGGWGGVAVHGQGEASVEQAVFEFGGKAEDGGARTLRGGALALTATTFRSDARGLWADEGSKLTAFADNKFVATPVAVTVPAGLIGALGEGNAFDRDGKIRSPGGAIKGNTLWRAQTVAIEFAGEVTFDGGELTIEPGSALLAGPEAQLTIGYYETATLVVKGTAAAPVTIGPAGRATWRGVSLAGHSRGNVLENLVLTGASNEAAIRVDGEVDARLSGVTCSKCSGAVIGWSCGAKVSSSQVLAADGTPKIEAAPEGC